MAFCEFVPQILGPNPETDIGVQPEDQKSKVAKQLESSYH